MSNKQKILIADDDPATCDVLHTILTDAGYEVSQAASASKALLLVENIPFDLILLDERLPDIHGSQLCPSLKKLRPTMRIVYCTGVTDMEHHGLPIIHKPFRILELLNVVRAALKEA